MKGLILVALMLCATCKEKALQPPPIAKGKCLVDRYVGPQAMQQGCQYEGYSWACVFDDKTLVNTCNRGQEANSERPPMIPPQPVPSTNHVDAASAD